MSETDLSKTPSKIPGTGQVVRAVAKVTFFEIVRDRVLYNVILAGAILFAVSFIASRLSVLEPDRVILDFGLSALSISSLLIAILTGAGMIAREFDRRTAYVALSRPITRMQFLLGKYAGLALVITCNWALLSFIYLLLLWGQSGKLGAWLMSPTWLCALFFALLQALFAGAITVFLSTFTTTSLSVIMSIGVFLIGINNTEIRLVAQKLDSPLARGLLKAIATLLPDFEHFSLGTLVTYGLPVPPSFAAMTIAYFALSTGICLTAAGLLIRGREA